MACPELTTEQVKTIIPQASDIQELDRGGQKIVFTGLIDGKKYALKFMEPNQSQGAEDNSELLDNVIARAEREVKTMEQCSTPHLVKIGPIGLKTAEVEGRPIIYFTEEFIDGQNLQKYLQKPGCLSNQELIRLALNISDAIKEIWSLSKIHRDIKPANIMITSKGDFILLDMGLVFDLQDESLSTELVGTPTYVSPEQLDFNNRRTIMNFRSDMFLLGLVMYEMATGIHPFRGASTSQWEVHRNIANNEPRSPIEVQPDIPEGHSKLIMRLLAKRPALRYRSIDMFQRAIREIESIGGNT